MRAGAAALLSAVKSRIAEGRPVRRSLPDGGRLHVDRPVPFLCVYRAPTGRSDPGTAELVRSQASYLIATDDDGLGELVSVVVGALADACGACLLLEIWSGADDSHDVRIETPPGDGLATTVTVLADALRRLVVPVAMGVEIVALGPVSPAGRPPLFSAPEAVHAGCLVVGLELPPIWRAGGQVYPGVLRALTRELAQALQQGFFEFTRVQTPARPSHYQMMGRRRLGRAVREADRVLAEIEASFDFLLAVTPVNTEEVWQEFCRSERRTVLPFRYRMLAIDPELGKRRLYELPLERLEDPVLALILREKRRDLDRQLGLLEDRDGPRFLAGSLQLFGGVEASLFAEAEAILATVPAGRGPEAEPRCDAEAFAARARAELAAYPASLDAEVRVRDDILSPMVSHGHLLVPRQTAIPATRVDALLQHEIGTHIVTYHNGRAQPLRVLGGGLAGYEALQEGLAMFAEFLVGGFDRQRLRLVAARVLAVRRLIDGVPFAEVVAELADEHDLPLRTAFGVATRAFRSGGLTKDAIYLRGLLQVLGHLAAGGDLEPLLVGKIGIEQVPLVEELLRRQVLRPAVVRPRWLDASGAPARLAAARRGLQPIDLLERVTA